MNHLGSKVAAELEALCREYLEREETQLTTTLQSLRQVRTALREGDPNALSEALRVQEGLIQPSEEMRQSRRHLREQASALVGNLPEAATLRDVLERLPAPSRQRLESGRQRVRQLGEQAAAVHESNVTLIYYCLDFFDRFFNAVTGDQAKAGCYGPTGNPQEAPCGSIIEARG